MDEQLRKAVKETVKWQLEHHVDRLAERAELAAHIEACATPDGLIYVYTWQRDCDCVEWDTMTTIPASVVHYERLERHTYEGAEGPVRMHVAHWEQAQGFEPTTRDRVMEAWENTGQMYYV